MNEINRIDQLLDAIARQDIDLDQAEAIVREQKWESAVRGFELWPWPGRVDGAVDAYWDLLKRFPKTPPAPPAAVPVSDHKPDASPTVRRCARCGAPAIWIAGASEALCARHQDSY